MKTNKYDRKEMVRFLIAGTIVNTTDFSIYYILFHFLPFSIAKGISFTCAGFVGYFLIKFWTFKHNKPLSFAEVGRYAIINFSALCLNVLVNQGILNLWPGSVWVALIIASAITGIFTFTCFKWWVFRTLLKEGFHYVWWKWLPLRFVVRAVARRQGFLDPIKLISELQSFADRKSVV